MNLVKASPIGRSEGITIHCAN